MTGEVARDVGVIRVALIEDQREFREALASLIDGTDGFSCKQHFGSVRHALSPIAEDVPDVVLVDIGLPELSGIEGVRILKERHPSVPALILTVYNDDERIFEAMCAGACGYLLKKTPRERLLECIREVIDGGAPMSPEIARRVVDLFRRFRPPHEAAYQLTPQEMRLLALLGEGHHYKTAAYRLGITINTVSTHMRRIYEKLQVHSKSEAVAKALREGIIH